MGINVIIMGMNAIIPEMLNGLDVLDHCKCGICHNLLDDAMTNEHCGHNYCSSCFNEINRGLVITCPECLIQFSPDTVKVK